MRKKLESSLEFDNYVSNTEKELKDIMEQYRISINRQKMKEEGNKGFNKCKDNKKAFFDYKKGKLFLRTNEQD